MTSRALCWNLGGGVTGIEMRSDVETIEDWKAWILSSVKEKLVAEMFCL